MAVFRLVGLRKNKRTGIWEYRRVVPRHLRPFHVGAEFKRSTGTDKRSEAERFALPLIAQFKALIARLDEKAKTAAPVTGVSDAVPFAVPMALQAEDLRAFAGELAQGVLGKHEVEPGPPEAYEMKSALPPLGVLEAEPKWGRPDDAWAYRRFMLLRPKEDGLPATSQGYVTRPAHALLDARGVDLPEDQWAAFCDLARDALDGAYAILQRRARDRATWTEDRLAQRFPVATAQHGAAAAVPITGLADHWKASKERHDEKTYDRNVKALGDFASFLGHDDATRVAPQDLTRWLNSLLEKRLSAKTINEGYRAGVKACFAAGAAAGALRVDPLAGVKYKIKGDPTRAAPRVPYGDADAKRLLTAARKETGARKWLPCLLAYTGARIGEVSQLYREDVRWASREEAGKGGWCAGEVAQPKGRDGVYFLRLTNEGKGQRLKNAASRREVPLHPELTGAGFVEFVASVKPGHFLFPELTAGKYGHKGDGGSRTYRKWARGEVGIKDARLTAHSWRHRFEDQLRHTGAPDEVRDALTGHARKGMGARYGHGHSLATKAEWIAKVPVIKGGTR